MSSSTVGNEEEKLYPSPLASHDDIVKDPSVFWDTLRRFHLLLSTKFIILQQASWNMILIFGIPVIGGKELDLHVLYVEVTRRSGYEKVGSFLPYNLCKTHYPLLLRTTHSKRISFIYLIIYYLFLLCLKVKKDIVHDELCYVLQI
ncbi:uncharacterized protein LOC107611772 [Arachis ipaensis]|uniref:uncharacterized protein LOC107611772 n=1 Tax=Arachis ipaensis TaxID=130454 RepID=UPI0007AFA5E0|nr:uncharacterized protein LOC107611772 [Arachis ipaensis]